MERGESWGDDCVVKLNYEDSRTRYVYLLTPTAMMQMTCVHSRYNTGMYTVGAWIAGWSEPAVLNDGRVDICLYCGMVNLSIVCPIPWSYTLVSHFSPPFLEANEQQLNFATQVSTVQTASLNLLGKTRKFHTSKLNTHSIIKFHIVFWEFMAGMGEQSTHFWQNFLGK